MHIVGTAGHVDHGKSSLVRALTGTDPDRLAEERRRGMTIELGFAHLAYPDGIEAGIVDVPGHERFLRTMVSGAAGMEIVVLVVSAVEGAKPQTLEHLAILQYLNVRRVIVALTKSDLVNDEERAFAGELLAEALAGTIAALAPVVAVSTVSGNGIDELRASIHAALVSLPPRAPHAPAYLPVDRVFAVPGHGTVVTGTLMQGRIAVGDTLDLTPLGRPVRVRGLHVFGDQRNAVSGGARVAANVVGVDTAEISRGAVLSSQEIVAASRFAVRFQPLPAARSFLKRRTPVRAYIGAAEILGTLVFDDALDPAPELTAVLTLRAPTAVIPGAAFVVRSVSPMRVLGGGAVGGGDASRSRQDDGEAAEAEAILHAVRKAGYTGATAAGAAAVANVREVRANELLDDLLAREQIRKLTKPITFVDGAVAESALARALECLDRRQREQPWASGFAGAGLARAIEIPESALVRLLAPFVSNGTIVYRNGAYATPDFTAAVTAEQRSAIDAAWPDAPLPAIFVEVVASFASAGRSDLSYAFQTLLATGAFIHIGEFVYRAAQVSEMRATLERALSEGKALTVADFRTLTGTSRKYAVPLLEYFDANGVTRRIGDVRVLRRDNPAPAPR